MGRLAWNAWYHCTCNTYGTWLRGDPRGWRARHHREHVEGDYKNPPPKGKHDALYARSKWLMKRDPVHLELGLRAFVLEAIVERLLRESIVVITAALTRKHLHVLARFERHNPRHFMGLAKKHASHCVRQEGLLPTGGLWAKRGKAKPIADRRHQVWTV